MQYINENEQIRKTLAKVRAIKEESELINLSNNQESTTNKNGEQIKFDSINTVGYYNSINSGVDKNAMIGVIGEFIKATGLILDSVNIMVDGNRVVISSETLKNPNTDSIKSITFDTDEDQPTLEVISGTITLDQDFLSLVNGIITTFSDNQIGRNKLITTTQGEGGSI